MSKISIIVNGPGIAEVKSLYGQASDWVQNVLEHYNIQVKVVKAYEMDPINAKEDDAWIITGSAYSVYDDFEWIQFLREKLFEMKKEKKPVLGICFGHQLIADTFGGKVVLNPKGWEIGSCKINLTPEGKQNILFEEFPDEFLAYQSHQDVVVDIPSDSVLLAENEMGIQSFCYNDNFYGVQFHPEFTKIVMEKYLEIRYRKGIINSIPKVGECPISSNILNNFIEKILKRG